jgi:hypothetical protein
MASPVTKKLGPDRGPTRSSGVQARFERTDEDDAPKLSGQAVLDSRWAFEQVLGRETVARALSEVPPSIREQYAGATALTWVPYDVMRIVHDAYGRAAGRPVEALLEDVLPKALERSFATVWRLLLRFTSDEALIARTPLLYTRTRSRGAMTARVVEPGVGVADLTGWASIPQRDIHALSISIRSFLMLAGRANVVVRGERTASGARFHSKWRV